MGLSFVKSIGILAIFLLYGCTPTNKSNSENAVILDKTRCVVGNCTDGKGQLNRLYQNRLFERQIGLFVNGKLHGKGKKKYYNADGSLDRVYDGAYKKGIPHGNMTAMTYTNKKIATLSKSIYIDGKEEGAFLYKSYRQGKLVYEQRGYYKKGKKEGKEINVLYDHKGVGSNEIIRHYINGRKIE